MTKLGALRCLGECALGGGCIAGGVECAKAKEIAEISSKENENLKSENQDLERRRQSTNNTAKYYKDEGEVLKKAVSYAATWLHKIGSMLDWDANKLRLEARNAKWGLRNNYLDGKGVSSNFHNWN